jgi:cell shape-determining protein MreD
LFGFLPVLWLTVASSTPQALVYAIVAGFLEDLMALSPLGISSACFLTVYLYTKWHRRMLALEGKLARFLLAGIAMILGYTSKLLLLLSQGRPPNQGALIFLAVLHLSWVFFLAGLALGLFGDLEKTQESDLAKLTSR